jgi:hypothetical protein
VWLDPDDAYTTDVGGLLDTITDRAYLADSVIWTGNAADRHGPSSDLNGHQRYNATAATEYLARATPLTGLTAYTLAFYGRMYNTAATMRIPIGGDATPFNAKLAARFNASATGMEVRVNSDVTVGTHVPGLNLSNVYVVRCTAGGTHNVYRNAVDRTGTPGTVALSAGVVSHVYSQAAGAGGWNFGLLFLYSDALSITNINSIGQYISDHYALGQTWALS